MTFYDLNELRRASSGRWLDILVSAGIPAQVLDGHNHPCPKCGGNDRFSAFRDLSERGAVHCRHCFTRGCPITPRDGISTLRWWLGQSFTEVLSFLAESVGVGAANSPPASMASSWQSWRRASQTAEQQEALSPDQIEAHTTFARIAYKRCDSATREKLAEQLGVTPDSLARLRVGVTFDGRCSTWPMRDEQAQVIGVRIVGMPWADAAGAKWSRRGSQSGIFLARALRLGQPDPNEGESVLYVTEGESDTAAALSIGLNAIGRASCSASTFFVDRHVRTVKPSTLVIIADNDEPGIQGAKRLAKSIASDLPASLKQVDVIAPPQSLSDLRAWIAQGAGPIEVAAAKSIASFHSPRQTKFDFAANRL